MDGPQHYILLSGFHSAYFFQLIDEYQIPVDCVIKFRAPSADRLVQFMTEIEERERLETNLKANLKISTPSYFFN